MAESAQRVLQRDSGESVFSRILSRLESLCEGFRAAVFFDSEGETIDYHSYLDPFDTRLLGAQYGVVLASGATRSGWLGLGSLAMIHVYSWGHEALLFSLGEGFGLLVIMGKNSVSDDILARIDEVIASLIEEAGI